MKNKKVLFMVFSFSILFSFQIFANLLNTRNNVDFNQDSKIKLDDAIFAMKTLANKDSLQDQQLSVSLENVVTILQMLSSSKPNQQSSFVFTVQDISGESQSQIPVSVACRFEKGIVTNDKTLYIVSANNRRRNLAEDIPSQMTDMRMYDDGSIESATVTFILPQLQPNEEITFQLNTSETPLTGDHITLDHVLNSGFQSQIELVQNMKIITVSFHDLVANNSVQQLYSGPICSKWLLSGPFTDTNGNTQNIDGQFEIIAYKDCERIRLTALIKNNGTPGQTAFNYDLTLSVGNMIFERKNLFLYPLTQWTKMMWWGYQPQIKIIDGTDPFIKKFIVDANVQNTLESNISSIPLTFGYAFQKGDVLSDQTLTASFGNGYAIPVQLDRKVFHTDGSLRHGIISMTLPELLANESQTISFSVIHEKTPDSDLQMSLSELLQTTYDTRILIQIDNIEYHANAKELIQQIPVTTWLSGPLVKEWHVVSPLKSADNTSHPHLTARFYIRAYSESAWIRTSVVIENNWTYVDNPKNIPYNITISTDNQIIYQQTDFVHYHHARWRKQFWQNVETSMICENQPVHLSHNVKYLMKSKAIPNFNPELIGNIPESQLLKTYNDWLKKNAPMSAGLIANWTYGADMWPILKYTGQYLMSMDSRIKAVTIGNAELAGSFPLHYRDVNTQLPLSIDDYPYCTTRVNDHINPETGQSEAPSKCTDSENCDSPHLVDPERKPSYTFIPYLVTGDYYFLEELHFWANFCMIHDLPSAREQSKGIIKGDNADMAFSIRTLGQAAYITPEDHPLKSYFMNKLLANINYYHETFLENQPNSIGTSTIDKAQCIVYKDDYFTWTLGYLVDLGFTAAYPILSWKTRFPVSRLTGAENFCWIFASNLKLQVADTDIGPRYETIKAVYDNSKENVLIDDGDFQCNSQDMADSLKQKNLIHYGKIGEMIGKPWATSEPARIQPALAAAIDINTQNAHAAWDQYMSRSVIPNYAAEGLPNYNIVPRRYQYDFKDSDNDGIIDGFDECPNSSPNETVNPAGCLNLDADTDGIFDYYDACPNTPNDAQVNAIGCHQSIPVIDSDHDGIPDDQDQCPSTPAAQAVDASGCPLTETAQIYHVGPGYPYARIIECPTHNLMAGDEIHVHYHETPYYEKFLLRGQGTNDKPIKLMGIPDAKGKKPILDGHNAVSPFDMNITNNDRQIIKVGQDDQFASYIVIDGFEIRNANNTQSFINTSGNTQTYKDNASAIRIENGAQIVIRNCDIHDNGNGIQTGKETHDLLIESCKIYNNGICGWDNSYIHNMYLSGRNGNTIIVQYCYIGELLSQGQQVKSRAEKFIFRYNWLEGGRNAQLDLVEDYEISDIVSYDAFVYGNIIIKPNESDNSVMIHFGGDQPDTSRKGSLHFYYNTCIIKDSKTLDTRRIFKISSERANVIANNNIFYMAAPNTYDLLSGYSNLFGTNNWLSLSIANANCFTQTIISDSPIFVDPSHDNYYLHSESACIDASSNMTFSDDLKPIYQYKSDLGYEVRRLMGNAMDIGAFEKNSSVDSDQDGILDDTDLCPDTPSNVTVDDIGCPIKLPIHKVFLSFDSSTGDIADGFDNWEYRSPEINPVYKMYEVGGFYSSSDSGGYHRAFFPYKNISAPQIMRYGYLDIDTQIPIRGTGCLKFVFTGGAYRDNDSISYSGSEIFYKSQFDTLIQSGENPYAAIPLFADEQFYVKFADSKTRTFDEAQGSDRLSFWIYLPEGSQENSPFPIRTIHYYSYIDTSENDHYYHWLTNIGMGSWTHIVLDAHPQRNNSGLPVDSQGNPVPYEYYRVGGHDTPGNAIDYFNRIVAFAIRIQLGDYMFPTPVYLDHFTFFKASQPENDETIANIGVGYNPETHEFDIGFCDKYRGNGCHATYEVRYSFRPITNASYSKTSLCTVVQAPNLDFNYTTDFKGQIKKPVTGYNQLWALLKLNPEDESQLEPGSRIYFAVKDISNRTYPDTDPYDEEMVFVDGMGQVRRIDLIKTISYEIYEGM